MAEAKQCDYCGELYKENTVKPEVSIWTKSLKRNTKIRCEVNFTFDNKISDNYGNHADVCDECIEHFILDLAKSVTNNFKYS